MTWLGLLELRSHQGEIDYLHVFIIRRVCLHNFTVVVELSGVVSMFAALATLGTSYEKVPYFGCTSINSEVRKIDAALDCTDSIIFSSLPSSPP